MGRAVPARRLDPQSSRDPFAAIIRRTADPGKADKRTRSKWSRVRRGGVQADSEPLEDFIRGKRGSTGAAPIREISGPWCCRKYAVCYPRWRQ
jgi:hypothetical protein